MPFLLTADSVYLTRHKNWKETCCGSSRGMFTGQRFWFLRDVWSGEFHLPLYSVHWGHCSDDSGPRTHYFVLTPWLHGFLLATFQEGAIHDMSVLEFEVINWSSEEWSFGTCQWRIRRCIRKQGNKFYDWLDRYGVRARRLNASYLI